MTDTLQKVNLSTSSQSTAKPCTDQDEVDFHSNMAPIWWDKAGYFGPLQSLNNLRVPFVRDCLIDSGVLDKSVINQKQPLTNIRILDVGCGGGIMSEVLAEWGADVVGIDPSEKLIELAESHTDPSLRSNLKYISGLLEDYAEENSESYDVVIASEVIEHVSEKDTFVEYCVKALKPGGSLIFTTPSRTLLSRILVIYVSEAIGLMAKGTHQYSKFISPQKLKELVNSYNCETKAIRGYGFNPWTRNCYWSRSTLLCYMLHTVKNKTEMTQN